MSPERTLMFPSEYVNTVAGKGVTHCMGHPRISLLAKVGMVVLIALTVFVSAVRPVTRPTGRLYARFGLSRMSLLTEAADDNDSSLVAPAVVDAHVSTPLMALGVLLLVLKTRRVELRSVPLRRLKLPARSPDRSVSSH